MTILAGRSTVSRLHQTVQRNILKNHQARYGTPRTRHHHPSQTTRNASSNAGPERQSQTIPGPGWAWVNPIKRTFKGYNNMQARSPLLTQVESAFVIWYLGDLSSQVMMTNVFIEGQYEPVRGLRAMLIGAIAAIPGYKWFQFLGNHFNYKSHWTSLLTKMTVNQFVFTLSFNAYFFAMQTLLSGGGWAETKDRVMNAVPVSWLNSFKFWPVVTAISFTFVPPQFRNIFASVAAIGWQTYLSWLNRLEENRYKDAQKLLREEEQRAGMGEQQPKKLKKRRKEEEGEGAGQSAKGSGLVEQAA